MLDAISFLTAQQLTRNLAHEARPDAPVVAHYEPRHLFLWSRLGQAPQRLADLVELPATGYERMTLRRR